MLAHHLLENAKMPLMLESDSSQKGEVIRGVLIVVIVANKDHLNFFHVVFLVHLEGAPVDHFLQCGLVGSRVESVFVQVLMDLVREFMALFKTGMVCADEHDTQILLLETYVDVEHVLFCAARDADGRPSLTICH